METPAESAPGGQEPKKRARAGRIKRDGTKAAGIEAGETAKPLFDPKVYAERLNAWWLNAKSASYFLEAPDGEWLELSKEDFNLFLIEQGLDARVGKGETLSQVERVRLYVQRHRKVDVSMSIAGHKRGVSFIKGQRILIRKQATWIEPAARDWSTLRAVLEGTFRLALEEPVMPGNFRVFVKGKERDRELEAAVWKALLIEEEVNGVKRWWLDQTQIFYGWVKLALEVYRRRAAGEDVSRNGQAFIFCGKPDGGKSFIQQFVLTPLLGDRMAKPESFMTRRTDFNAELFSSEHLCMGDAPLSTDMKDRLILGEFIKMIVAEQWHRFHPKGRDAIIVPPVWRLSISVNDDQDNLRSLPPMKEGVVDKCHLIHANAVALPTDTRELGDYMALGRAVKEQLPGFVHWLLHEWTLPEVLKAPRFGMVSFQAPDLMRELFEDSPHGALMDILDSARWSSPTLGARTLWDWVSSHNAEERLGVVHEVKWTDGTTRPVWEGPAAVLRSLLESDDCTMKDDARSLLKNSKLHWLLARLKKEEADRVAPHRTKHARHWRIAPPPGA